MEKFSIDKDHYDLFLNGSIEWLVEGINDWVSKYNSELIHAMMDERLLALYCYKFYIESYKESRDRTRFKGIKFLIDLDVLFEELKNPENLPEDKGILVFILDRAKRITFLMSRLSLMGYYSVTLEDEFTFRLITKATPPEKEINYPMPFKIALLNELDFFNLPTIKKLSKEKQNKIIKLLIGGDERSIKGNISVLDPNSVENRLKYTANNYIDEVKKLLE